MDAFTDVIAFNLEEDPFEGEIYISYQRVKDNASDYNQTFDNEMKRVLIHGLLHLCGLRDSTDNEKKRMTSMENIFIKKNSNNIIVD